VFPYVPAVVVAFGHPSDWVFVPGTQAAFAVYVTGYQEAHRAMRAPLRSTTTVLPRWP
jgi:hypothetical protein